MEKVIDMVFNRETGKFVVKNGELEFKKIGPGFPPIKLENVKEQVLEEKNGKLTITQENFCSDFELLYGETESKSGVIIKRRIGLDPDQKKLIMEGNVGVRLEDNGKSILILGTTKNGRVLRKYTLVEPVDLENSRVDKYV
jgi:hypothetical protein